MDFPDTHAERTPDKVAYELGATQVTYAELVDDSIRIANLLRERGIADGDVIAILLPNVVGLLEVAWAAQRSGLRYTAIAERLTVNEIAYILADSGARALFTATSHAAVAAAALAEVDRPVAAFTVDGPAAGHEDVFEELRPLLAARPARPTGPEREGVDLLYSSGTTGRPKGVAATLPNAPLGTAPGTAPFLQATWGFDADTVYLSPAPLYHAAPLRTSMTVQRFGGSVVVMPKFDAAEALRLVEARRVTHTQMVPTMFVRMLQLPEEVRAAADLSSLRAVIHAAAPCPPDVKRAMIDWVGPIVDEYYSCTEAILLTVIRSAEALERPGSVGRAVLGTPHVLDADGNELPPGEHGTIWSEGGLDFSYLNAPEKTAATRDERGWRTVGDLGYVDADGYLYLSDRREDLVLVGGVNVYPQEAENVLVAHPDVADAAVFGVSHPEYGAEVRAVVQLRPGLDPSRERAEALLEHVRERLTRVKCPRTLDFAEELPRTPTGKLLRRVLKEQYAAG
ncbi:long-chain acyl-CoA synthetase [Nocardioides zeae]|uniref:Long-chain acyl-CoA synthetase n=1 Tax=Nocardioides zeae TaxID=1457234 RepID=A0ACC6IMH6_9ACTN|nr:AMP-binding protein [Nocardioides zeae]MDR6173834.1 long-chain acyl-CoA synthetase [Nocardioides zeae]MDR6211878.1 long-chain acyl-CoA synthetase [Nocardioides zeae]